MTAGSGFGAAKSMSPIGWLGLPMLFCAIATILLATPIRVFSLALPEPVFPFTVAFAWAVIRPSVLPPFALLIMGLFLDVFWGGPQGLWPLCFLATYASVLAVRRLILGQEFIVMWALYGAAVALAFGLGYLLMSMVAGTVLDPIALGWQYLATLVLFPFAHRLIGRYEDADVRFR